MATSRRLYVVGSGWSLRDSRSRLEHAGELRERGGTAVAPITILDLSLSGCLVRSGRPLDVGAEVRITMHPFGEAAAQVIWATDDRYGLRFVGVDGALSSNEAPDVNSVFGDEISSVPSERWSRVWRLLLIIGVSAACWMLAALALIVLSE